MPKKYRRYQGGGIAQLKPRPGMRQSKRSERHPLWGRRGPNPDAPIERLLRGARGVGRKVRGADRALDRHIEERWGYDPEGDAPELRRLLELGMDLPSKIGDKVSGGIRKLLRRTRPPEGGYQEDFYELKNILDKAPGSEMEWEIPGRPGRGPLRIPRPFDPQMLRLGRGRELQEERNRRTGRATKEQLKRRMLESLLESPMKMEYMPPRQFGAGLRSPRRSIGRASGGIIGLQEGGFLKLLKDLFTNKIRSERKWPPMVDSGAIMPEGQPTHKQIRAAMEASRQQEFPTRRPIPDEWEEGYPGDAEYNRRQTDLIFRRINDKLDAEARNRRERERGGLAFGGLIGLQTGGMHQTGGGTPQAGGMPQPQGYGGPGQMQIRQETLHPGVAQQYGQLTGAIMQAGAQPLQQFGPGVAGMTQMEAAAQAGIGAYGRGQGPQGTMQGMSTLGQAARGVGSMIPQQQALAGQYGALAPQALQQAQAGATGMQQLGARAQLQGQLAGAGMRTTGGAAQTEQQALGAEQQRRGAVAQTQMQGLGQQAQQAGQAALGAQQGFGTGITGMGTAAQQLGQTAMGAMGETGVQSQAQAQEAAQRMRDIGGQAPELQRGADLSEYMSQYTKGVTDPQLQQLMEFQRMQGQELGSQAAGAGAFGSLRQGVQAATQAREASQQAADIIGKGQQEAFQSAQQAFQADRAAQQQAQQTGLSAEQQAAATQAGAQGQALAAQQAGVGAAQQGTAQEMQAQQQAAGMADIGAGRQLQGLQAQAGATAQGIGMGQQGLAAQQAAAAQGAQFGLQGQQQGFQAAQAGTQLGLGALQGAQAAGQQGFGTAANLMQGQQGAMGAQMGAYGQLAGIGGQQLGGGQQQQQQFMARQRMMEQAGARQRQLGQAGLDYQRAQFEQRQQYPQQQIGWMNQQLGALPYQSTVTQGTYAQQPGTVQSLMGAGLQGLGLYNAYQNRGTQGAPTP